jgi:hypothetical protein
MRNHSSGRDFVVDSIKTWPEQIFEAKKSRIKNVGETAIVYQFANLLAPLYIDKAKAYFNRCFELNLSNLF